MSFEPKVKHYRYNFFTYLTDLRLKLADKGFAFIKNDRRLLALKNKHFQQRAFVIGNGPSLKKTNLKLLKNEITIASNKIYLKKDFHPTYYTVEDQLLAMQFYKQINKVTSTTKLFPQDLKRLGIKSDKNTIFFRLLHQYPNYPQFQPNALKSLYSGGTITYTNLQLALYMGIKEVYLIGVDFDYGSLDKASGDYLINSRENPYFHPQYREHNERWNLPHLSRMKKSFKTAKMFYKNNKGIIYNATIGGKLEVFPRVKYQSLFK